MRRFAETAEAIAGTTSKLKKIGFLAAYFRTLNEDDLRAAAVFLTGKPFALTDARTLNVGWSALVNAVQSLSGASDEDIHQIYLDRGDLGEMAERLLQGSGEGLSPAAIQSKFCGLVKISGRAEIPGRPLLYETTEFFLDHFGLRNLDELPNVEELRTRHLPVSPRPTVAATEDRGTTTATPTPASE